MTEEIIDIEVMRQRLGVEENDESQDAYIASLSPLRRVKLLVGWHLGDGEWTNTFVDFLSSQGLYITTNPEADGVIDTNCWGYIE